MKKEGKRIKPILKISGKKRCSGVLKKLELTIDSSWISKIPLSIFGIVLKETNTVDVKSEAIESGETAILKLPENQIKIKISMVK